ncbi:MAG: energy transducer TonB [Phenylobacterium sp.]
MRPPACISAFLALGMVIGSPPALAEQAVDKAPNWKRAPSQQDFLSVFPKAAMDAGVDGKVRLTCRVTITGLLTGCSVLSETPPGLGFGQAALAIAPQMLMTQAIKDGKPVEFEAITIPINFEAPSPSTGSRVSGVPDPYGTTFAVLTKVPWTATPSTTEIWAAYPQSARERKLSGRITLECVIQKDGVIGACKARNLEANTEVFLPAARSLATKFRAPLKFDDGKSTVGSHVLVPFEFQVDQAQVPTFASRLPWLAIPGGDQFEAELGQLLKAAGAQEVKVRAECAVGPDARLKDCNVLSAAPEIAGLQPAINRLAPGFILPRWTDTGSTFSGGKVVVPLRYSLPEPAADGS